MSFDDLVADFSFLDDWEDRYRYVIELGQNLADMDLALKTEQTKVSGCTSQVWLHITAKKDQNNSGLDIQGDSDAAIVKGLVAILITLYANKTPQQIVALDAEQALDRLDLKAHLSSQRANGLVSMIDRIKSEAAQLTNQ